MDTETFTPSLTNHQNSINSQDIDEFHNQASDQLFELINSRETQLTEYELHKYFMNVAILISQHRKKIKHQAGCCIVSPTSRIIGIGNYTHNETLKSEILSLFKDKSKPKNDYLNHAEVNAIANKKESSLENCTMYVTCFPCIECSKLIAHSGITKVVFIEDNCCQTLNENEIMAAKLLLELAGVTLVKFICTE